MLYPLPLSHLEDRYTGMPRPSPSPRICRSGLTYGAEPYQTRPGGIGTPLRRLVASAWIQHRVAYALPPRTREERASCAKVAISEHCNGKQQTFLDFVLSHYVGVGVDELAQEKLTPLLRLRYFNSITDAIKDLGVPEEISKVFERFQKYLYEEAA